MLKATEIRCVFSLRLKTCKELALRMTTAGRLFQMAVAECLKARDDRLVRGLVGLTVKRLRALDWLMSD